MQKPSTLLNLIVKYTVACIVIFVPLFPKFPLFQVPGTFVAIRFEDLILAFSALILAITIIPKFNKFRTDKLNQSVMIFIFAGFLSLASGIYLTKTVVPHVAFLHWVRRIEYLIPLFLGIEAVKMNRQNLNFFIKLILLVIFFVFIYGYGQMHFNWPVIITQNEEYSKGIALRYVPGGHINSTFAGHYDLGTFLVLSLPFLITSFFILKDKIPKVFFASISLLSLWLLVNTASRISLVSYLLSVTLSLLIVRRLKALILVFLVSFIFVGFSNSLVSRYERIIEVTNEKLNEFKLINYVISPVMASQADNLPKPRVITQAPTPTPVFEDRSTNIRLNVEWPRSLRALSKNPLLGTGYSSITLATDNDYLRALGETGVVGFLAFSLVFLRVFERFLAAFPLTKKFTGLELAFLAGTAASLPGIFLNAFFIDIFEASKFAIMFWLFIGFSVSLVNLKINEKHN